MHDETIKKTSLTYAADEKAAADKASAEQAAAEKAVAGPPQRKQLPMHIKQLN